MYKLKNIWKYICKKKVIFFSLTFLFLAVFSVTNYWFGNVIIVNHNNQYLVQYTYYHPNDATGSGNCTGSGKCVNNFTIDENGWYHYETNGKKYLVIAAATNLCKNAYNHCGIDVKKHGMATSIKYYNYFDTLNLTVNGRQYEAIVLDSCGACMWKRQDERGHELFDIFVKGPSATKPQATSGDASSYLGNFNTGLDHYSSTYMGDIKSGFLYKRIEFKEYSDVNTAEYKKESNINEVIDEIFDRAKTSYLNYQSSTGIGEIGGIDAGPYSDWRQCDSRWSGINLGNSKFTMCSSGCLVTSVAIQMSRSGLSLSPELNGNINPGSFVTFLNQKNGFENGNFKWNTATMAAPNFNYVSQQKFTHSISDKISIISSLLSSGNNYLIAHVMGSKKGDTTNHWVAVTGVSANDVYMIDPSGRGTSLDSTYGLQYLDRVAIYRVGG